MMPVLSPRMMMLQSWSLESMTMRITSLRAMDSAQPVSLPSAFHPGVRVHASHRLPRAMPMPQLVDTSTHKSGSSHWHGLREREHRGLSSTASHQRRLSTMDLGAWCMAKSFGNLEMNDANGGSLERSSL